jgi:DEAD/DEAH box helicase domain-containing protein
MLKASPAPWKVETGIDPLVARWLKSEIVKPCLVTDETLSARDGKTAELPALLRLQQGLVDALSARGIRELYTHQAEAFERAFPARGDRALVIATPTASGKSLCFHLPVLSTLASDPEARALYLFPTKALSRDQESSVRELVQAAKIDVSAVVYDGDTPGDARRAARERSRIILTNPDMLHTGILPHHTQWARTLQNLKYVVVDELHTYRGVFGSHVAHVLARLRRIARFHGSDPMFIGATATIGNPKEHAARMFGLPEDQIDLLSESGAPAGSRRFFIFNPPIVNEELGIRASYVKQAVMLAADLAKARVPTIVFGQSRNNVEMMLRYLRERVTPEIPSESIQGYRGGYLPQKRREIEQKLRSGEILCVVATNALELGIDIGDLDAVICAGYPGSIAALWQRFGRAGRRKEGSIAVLVASSAPLDQFLARESKYVLGAPIEEARIDPENPEIYVQHLKCGAFELPFKVTDSYAGSGAETTSAALKYLESHAVVHQAKDTFHWATDAYPANHVSLRSIGWDNVVIIDVEYDKSIAEIDWRSAQTMVHDQAIYQHDGETWQVERFDHENHKAYVRKVVPDYFTEAMTHVQISVLEDEDTTSLSLATCGHGEVSIVEKVIGYKKIKFFTHENEGYGEVRLPEMQMHTDALWITLPEQWCEHVEGGRASAIDGLRGLGIALETVSALSLMCDPRDLGVTLGDTGTDDGPPRTGQPRGYAPTLFVYEHTPGGIGLASKLFLNLTLMLERTRELIQTCTCKEGCPVCVGPAESSKRKRVALALLDQILQR